jgi:glycosyltransferase involved in cell wall biosynthesis
MIKDITPVIIAKNASKTIGETMDSLKMFRQVIVYLNNSTDNTKDIVSNYPNSKIVNGEFIGFGQTKNKAGEYSDTNWILSLDSDEVMNDTLLQEITNQNFEDETVVYKLKRDNYFLGAKTSNIDYVMRVYNKTHTQFNDNKVHEKLIIHNNTKVVKLTTSFKHHNITDINQTLTKMIQYTDLGAKEKKLCFFSIIILKAGFAFFQSYFLKFYIKDGWRGFVISITYANRRFYKYLKQFINCKGEKNG